VEIPNSEFNLQCYPLSSEPKMMDLPHLYRQMLRARSYELAVEDLWNRGLISGEVVDLRSLRPLDVKTVVASVGKTGRLLAVDEDYREFGLSGELAAVCLEAGLSPRFGRVCVEDTLPYARHLENAALPNVDRIITAARELVNA
jgi:pyruvate/2-oxoglutarate/acetoin dehydrogenase E1 component